MKGPFAFFYYALKTRFSYRQLLKTKLHFAAKPVFPEHPKDAEPPWPKENRFQLKVNPNHALLATTFPFFSIALSRMLSVFPCCPYSCLRQTPFYNQTRPWRKQQCHIGQRALFKSVTLLPG